MNDSYNFNHDYFIEEARNWLEQSKQDLLNEKQSLPPPDDVIIGFLIRYAYPVRLVIDINLSDGTIRKTLINKNDIINVK